MRNRKDICVRKSNKIKKLPKLLLCRGGNFCLFKFATNVRSIKPNLKITKKAQEEVVGFVAIVVIVAILLVLLLGFSIKKPSNSNQESKDLYQFLESLMKYTSQCAISYEPDYSELGELIKECYSGASLCLNQKSPCEIAEEDIKNIIEASFKVGEAQGYKGYEFKSIYTETEDEAEKLMKDIILIKKGNCSSSYIGSEVLNPAFPGTISSSFKLCY